MSIQAANTNPEDCGCNNNPGNPGPGEGSTLFRGNFASLAILQTSEPQPASGSYAYVVVPGGKDITATWDAGDTTWRLHEANNKVREVSLGLYNGPFPNTNIIPVAAGLTVEDTDIVMLYLVRNVAGIVTKERYLWGKGKGSFIPMGNLVVGSDLIAIGTERVTNADMQGIPNTITRNLGVIANDITLVAHINALPAFSYLDLSDNTTTYFIRYTQNNIVFVVMFAGANSANGFGLYSSGGLHCVASDFIGMSNSTITPAPAANNYRDKKPVTSATPGYSAGAYTMQTGDDLVWLEFNLPTPFNIIVPAGIFGTGKEFEGEVIGLGQATFVGSGVTIFKGATEQAKTAEQNSVFGLKFRSNTEVSLYGKLALV